MFYFAPNVCLLSFFTKFAFKISKSMKKHTIDLFMPLPVADILDGTVENIYAGNPLVHQVWLLGASLPSCPHPAKCSVLCAASLTATSLFHDIAQRATADFVVFIGKEGVDVDMQALDRMLIAMPKEATMAYADYRKIQDGEKLDAPTIDYQAGSLRNDFDFGSLLVFRTSALKEYLAESLDEYRYAGLYQLRLAMSRIGSIYHFNEYLYSECENDTRKSGEKQFDYVNPAQREVQVEMEKVCTHHLKAIGGYLPPCKYDKIELSGGDFPVEASVVIPVLNRETTIADAIASVLSQQTNFPFNILVIDNHSTDRTGEIIESFNDERVVHIVPECHDLGIGGCWELAVNDCRCGRFAVQLDSDDIYSSSGTLQRIVEEFYAQQCAMMVGTYRICDFELNTLPPGVIDHREWTEDNGRNNALRINGLGAPRAFYTPVIREVGFPNVSYGEDYAVGLQISRRFRIGRIYDVLYLCRRWGGNSDAALSHAKVNAHNTYKDSLRTAELEARIEHLKSTGIPSRKELQSFFDQQLTQWPVAANRYDNLKGVRVHEFENGIKLQYNPARAVSAAAKVDKTSIATRACFLCSENRPEEQIVLKALGALDVLVNPYPILPFHLTLPVSKHVPQQLREVYVDMLNLAREWHDLAIFYNGAKCGASAPDHAHLQAGNISCIPLLSPAWCDEIASGMRPLLMKGDGGIYSVDSYIVPLFMVVSGSVSCSKELMKTLVKALPLADGESEPMMNVIAFHSKDDGYVTIVVPRSSHRPACYGIEGESARLVSPGALDMAGLVITPREKDFIEISQDEAVAMLNEVALTVEQAVEVADNISVGYENC
jgi:glycosyltransferase involved in cell wall biosynthesis